MRNIFKDRRNWPALLLLLTILGIWTGAIAQQGNQVIPTGAAGIAANGPGIPSASGSTVFYASNFGLPSTGFSSCNTTMTASGTSVTNLSSDPLYVKGYTLFGTSQNCQSFDGSGIYCVTLQTITAVSNGGHTATFGTPGSASGTCNTTGGETWWFPSESNVAIQNAFLASIGLNTSYPGYCGKMELPPGIYAIGASGNIGTTTVSPCGNDNTVLGLGQTSQTAEVAGCGAHCTTFIMLPTFNGNQAVTPTGCTTATLLFGWSSPCNFGPFVIRDLSVDWGGYTATANLGGKCLFQIGGGPSEMRNLGDYDGAVQAGGPASIAYCIFGQTNAPSYGTNLQNFAGAVTSVSASGPVVLDHIQHYEGAGGNSAGNAVSVGGTGAQPSVLINSSIVTPNSGVALTGNSATLRMANTTLTGTSVGSGGGSVVIAGSPATVYSTNNKIACSTGSLGSCFQFGNNNEIVFESGDLSSGGINTFITSGTTGNSVFDMGGNTYSPSVRVVNPNTGAITWNGSGGPSGTLSIQASLNGGSACVASQTLFLFPYGQTATPTCSSATAQTQIGGYVAPRAGTLEFLNIALSVGGIAGDAVTVLKNGSTTTLTCTFGTATSCQDLTHTVAIAAGDMIGFQITTGAVETAKTPTASVVLF